MRGRRDPIRWKGTLRHRLIWTALTAVAIAVMFALNWSEQHTSFPGAAQQRSYLLLWLISAAGLVTGAWIDRPRTLRNLLLAASTALLLGAALGTAAWPEAAVQISTALPLLLGAAMVLWPDSPGWMRRREAEESAARGTAHRPVHRTR